MTTNIYMSEDNPHIPAAIELGRADAKEGKEPFWYRVGDSYVSAVSGLIGNPYVAAAYLRAYSDETAVTAE